MNEYFQDIFYTIDKLEVTEIKKLLQEAKDECNSWRVDILDCSISTNRHTIEMSFENIMKRIDDNPHFIFIHRRGYDDWKGSEFHKEAWCLEVGFTTLNSPSYFLWIHLPKEKIDYYVNKYNLEIK